MRGGEYGANGKGEGVEGRFTVFIWVESKSIHCRTFVDVQRGRGKY